VTLRGVVTATNRFGSTAVTTSNFYYDEAGLPIESRKDLRPFVYAPAQLRAWYGLGPDQDGAGQTIVITAFWRTRGLRTAVDRFSSHYSLPLVCGTVHAGRNCFKLRDLTFGQQPKYVVPGEDEDIEWAHAIAPKARIVVLRARSIPALLYGAGHVRREVRAHVISASWGAPREPGHEQTLFRQVAAACHIDQVVCTFPSGDGRAPGDPPSNSPYALAVGGSVFQARQDGSLATEAYWRHGGFGATGDREPRPVWQMGLPACRGLKVATSNGPVLRVRSPSCDYRAVPDVTATADGVLDYEIPAHRHRDPGWFFAGGTSLSSPLWAGLIALADQELARDGQPAIGVDELHRVLYHGAVSAGLDDLGDRGWDERTGWGSPKAGIVDVLARAIERGRSSS
jgi:subtilase family serine protease